MSSLPAAVTPVAPASQKVDANYERRIFIILGALAVIYAFFAGLRTVSDFDLGWQMATGRWILQHHAIPSVDVLSYTAAGQPWIYPVGAGIIFYVAHLLGGFGLISWIGAAACVATVLLLLRKGSAMTALIAILAVPVIAMRIAPRADMFTVVLFAAFLSVLWQQHRTGDARLWLLPVLMVAWVNLHLGFVAGLALMGAYVAAEVLEGFDRAQREPAFQRLRRAAPWLLATCVATLVNPWGWGIYRALILQQRVNSQHEYLIAEWIKLPLTWTAIINALSLRETTGAVYMLLAIAVIAAGAALWRVKLGAAILLLGASYAAVRYQRMDSIFACVVVVVAAPILAEALAQLKPRLEPERLRLVATAVVVVMAALAGLRCFDLATNRFYLRSSSESTFGAGASWWFPQRAADFIETNRLPGEVFNTYDEGGYVSLRLGPARRDTIDGRAPVFGAEAILRNNKLLELSPDSPQWQDEAARYNINTILLPLGRFDGIELVKLKDFCTSTTWRPVYLDEVSAVFVRRTPQTEDLLRRFPVDCSTAVLPGQAASASNADLFNAWANAAAILAVLGRNSEALDASNNALSIFPDSSFIHWLRGNLLLANRRVPDSEAEYREAVSLESSDVTWAGLADFYRATGRNDEAREALERAVALSPRPFTLQVKLGYLYLTMNQPNDALRAFDAAQSSAPKDIRAADGGTFDFMLAQGRSVAWNRLGDPARAISFQEQAAALQPNAAEPWRRLAKLYREQGRAEDALRAEMKAAAAEQQN